uniref:Uncharacterized protein n=1 Tax=Meloidogyne enterolobii TaxID=390850 RepID=A0A6V7TIC4_MELEN|nr:unnamed protein product [Meloidogyne enterolobii]
MKIVGQNLSMIFIHLSVLILLASSLVDPSEKNTKKSVKFADDVGRKLEIYDKQEVVNVNANSILKVKTKKDKFKISRNKFDEFNELNEKAKKINKSKEFSTFALTLFGILNSEKTEMLSTNLENIREFNKEILALISNVEHFQILEDTLFDEIDKIYKKNLSKFRLTKFEKLNEYLVSLEQFKFKTILEKLEMCSSKSKVSEIFGNNQKLVKYIEKQCNELIEYLKGFDIEYSTEKKKIIKNKIKSFFEKWKKQIKKEEKY